MHVTLLNFIGLPCKNLFHITFLVYLPYHLYILIYFPVPSSQDWMREETVYSTQVMDRNDYFAIPNFETVPLDFSQTCSTPRRKKKKSNNKVNKRRFSDEQIRSLETIFYSTDSKLDSRKKVQLATELGLQPRQIAIWFQNRRARWKSKEMENNFRSLRANYDNLASQFKTLQEQNNSLILQLQKISVLLQGPHQGYYLNDIGKTTYETQEKPKSFLDESKQGGVTHSNNNHNIIKKCKVNEEGDRGLQMTHLLQGRSNDVGHVQEQACQLLNPNGSFELDGEIAFEYQSCSSLEGLSFWG